MRSILRQHGYMLLYLCVIVALCEGDNDIQKKMKYRCT